MSRISTSTIDRIRTVYAATRDVDKTAELLGLDRRTINKYKLPPISTIPSIEISLPHPSIAEHALQNQNITSSHEAEKQARAFARFKKGESPVEVVINEKDITAQQVRKYLNEYIELERNYKIADLYKNCKEIEIDALVQISKQVIALQIPPQDCVPYLPMLPEFVSLKLSLEELTKQIADESTKFHAAHEQQEKVLAEKIAEIKKAEEAANAIRVETEALVRERDKVARHLEELKREVDQTDNEYRAILPKLVENRELTLMLAAKMVLDSVKKRIMDMSSIPKALLLLETKGKAVELGVMDYVAQFEELILQDMVLASMQAHAKRIKLQPEFKIAPWKPYKPRTGCTINKDV